MAYEQADLDAVNELIAVMGSGKSVSEYEVRGRKLKYRDLSLSELQALRRMMSDDMAAASGEETPRYGLIMTGKGL